MKGLEKNDGTGFPRVARIVSLLAGLVFAVGAIWKVFIWGDHVAAMSVYTVLSWLPTSGLAAGSLAVELLVGVWLLLPATWQRYGLPAATLFMLATGILLAVETLAGGSGECGCLPFLSRQIGWLATAQNLTVALFLGGLWGMLGAVEVSGETPQ